MQFTIDGYSVFGATGGRAHHSGRPLALFVHGAGLDHTVWAFQSRWLAFHGWNVLAPDLPGHGRSAGPPLPDIGAMATWLAAMIVAAESKTATLIGHSMGSLIALETASCFPERVASLVLIGAAAAMPVHPDLLAAAAANDHAAIDMVNLWGYGYAAGLGGSPAPGLWLCAVEERVLEKAQPGVLHNDLAACGAYLNGAAAAARVAAPTLLICGERDQMTPLRNGRLLAATIARATLVAVPGAGHMLPAERPYEVQSALARHLAVDRSWRVGRLVGVLVVAFLALACLGVGNANAGHGTAWPTAGWQQATPTSVGLDEKTLLALDTDVAAGNYSLVDSFEVFRCGKQVFGRKYAHDYSIIYSKEARTKGPLNARLTGPYNYFDPAWHPYYQGTDLHSMQSVSKTVTSVILGIAITRGDFKASLNTPVLKYFDDAKVRNIDERKRRMTLKDVLTMTAGLAWNENVPYDDPRNDASSMEAADDWVQYVIDKPMATDPGTAFNYSSGATELLAYIFQKQTGRDIDAYAEQHLFAPLGIKHHWKRNYLGVVDTEGGLFLGGADLAKIGYLYLHGGMWGGKQIVSREWVKQSVTPFVDTGWQGLKYGFKWWLYPRRARGQFVWMGIGFGGQRLMVFPEEQMIAVFTGWDILQDPAFDAELVNRLLPALIATKCGDSAR